jgi:hypothetical protein
MGMFDDETLAFITQTYQSADAFLFGRKTYEVFAASWGGIAEMRAHPIGVALNEAPKYLASTTLTEPRWAETTVLATRVLTRPRSGGRMTSTAEYFVTIAPFPCGVALFTCRCGARTVEFDPKRPAPKGWATADDGSPHCPVCSEQATKSHAERLDERQ